MMRTVKIAIAAAAFVLAAGGTVVAQHHPGGGGSGTATPPPAPPPATTPSGEKPAKMYESDECLGAMVYVSSKTWRECCLLCAMGDDSPSKEEKAEAEKANEHIVVNQYFDVTSLGRGGGGGGGGAAKPAAAEPAAGASDTGIHVTGAKKEPSKGGFAHNRMGGLAPLSGLSSGFGGFDSK
jgi:hypothetical protein